MFYKVLFESKVHNLIFDCLGADYLLSHIQIKLEAGNTYLDWHRDSYNYGKKLEFSSCIRLFIILYLKESQIIQN